MRSWNHWGIKGQWRHMTRKLFFEFLTPKNHPWTFKNHRNVFYSSQGTRWMLKFCSSSIRSKVIGDHGFHHFSALDLTSEVTGWPRTLSLYINLFVSRRATRSFFPRSSSSIRGETARGGRTNPPLCRGRMRNGLCRRGLTLSMHMGTFCLRLSRYWKSVNPILSAPNVRTDFDLWPDLDLTCDLNIKFT